MSPRKEKAENRLTDVELEMMNIIWARGSATVRDVLAALPTGRELAYTSAATIIRILQQKGVLQSEKQGKTHIYHPLLSKEEYEKSSLDFVVENVFSGEPSALVKRLVDSKNLSAAEKAEIKKLIEEL